MPCHKHGSRTRCVSGLSVSHLLPGHGRPPLDSGCRVTSLLAGVRKREGFLRSRKAGMAAERNSVCIATGGNTGGKSLTSEETGRAENKHGLCRARGSPPLSAFTAGSGRCLARLWSWFWANSCDVNTGCELSAGLLDGVSVGPKGKVHVCFECLKTEPFSYQATF